MSAFLGGFLVTSIGWAGPNAVEVRFETAETGFLYQLYAGRTRIASTLLTGDRRLIGQLFAEDIPAPLTVLRVTPGDRLTDFGSQLPRWPWNRFRLGWTADASPADLRYWDVYASPSAGEPVDEATLIGRVLFRGDGDYTFDAPPVTGSGEWIYQVTPRDGTFPDGNLGDPAEVTVEALVPPPDVTADDDDNRFTLAIEDGSLVASFDY